MSSFVIRKIKDDLSILKMDNKEGFNYKLKKTNSLKVREINIINTEIINNLIVYNFNNKYQKIFEYYLALLESDSDNTESNLIMALNEVARLRSIIIKRYQKYLHKKNSMQILKKLKILENEIRMKLIDLKLIKEQELVNNNKEEKSMGR